MVVLAACLLVGAVLAAYWYMQRRQLDERLAQAFASAKGCGFQAVVKLDTGRDRTTYGQIALGGQVLDCETGKKSKSLECVETKLTAARIPFHESGYRGNCTYVPPVP
jgi:hypothetical protein